MIKNSIIQLYFRKILIESMQSDTIQVPIEYENTNPNGDDGTYIIGMFGGNSANPVLPNKIQYENTEMKNYVGTYLVEQLIPLDDRCFSGLFEAGSGIYKITVFSDSGDGLAFSDLCDTIANYFKKGTHIIDTKYKVCIDNVFVTGTLYSTNEDKIQKSINVEYRKFFNN